MKTSWKKRTFIVVSGIFLFLSVAVFLLPSFFSSDLGLKTLQHLCKNTLEIKEAKISLSWLHGQKIESLKLLSSKRGYELSIQELRTEASLFHILFQCDVGNLIITQPNLHIQTLPIDREKITFQKAGFDLPHFIPTPFPISGAVQIQNGSVSIDSSHLDNLSLNAQIGKDQKTLEMNLYLTIEELNGKGNLECLLSQKENRGLIALCLQTIPLKALDPLLRRFYPYLPDLTTLLGSSLDAQINGNYNLTEISLQANVKSPNLQLKALLGTLENRVYLKEPLVLDLKLPSAQSTLIPNITLDKGAQLSLHLTKGECPFISHKLDLTRIHLDGSLQIQLPELAIHGKTLENVQARGNFNADAKVSSLNMDLESKLNESPFSLTLQVKTPLVDLSQMELFLQTKNFPLNFLATDLAYWMGDNLQIQASYKKEALLSHLSLTLESEKLSLKELKLSGNDTLSLQEAIPFTYTSFSIRAFQVGLLQGNLQKLQLPLDGNVSNIACLLTCKANTLKIEDKDYGSFEFELALASLKEIALNLNSAITHLTANLCWDPLLQNLSFNSPLKASFHIDPKLLNNSASGLPSFEMLSGRLEMKSLNLDLTKIQESSFDFKASLDPFVIGSNKGKCTFNGIQAEGKYQGKNEEVSLWLSSLPDKEAKNPAVKLQLELQKWSLPAFSLSYDCRLDSLPVFLLETLLKQKDLTSLLSDVISLHLEGKTHNQADEVSFQMSSQLLSCEGQLIADAEKLFIKKPLLISYHLTPEGFDQLSNGKETLPFTLTKPSDISFNIHDLLLPLKRDPEKHFFFQDRTLISNNLSKWHLQAELKSPFFSFRDKKQSKEIILEEVKLSLSKQPLLAPSKLDIASDVLTLSEQGSKEGQMRLNLQVSDLFTLEGGLNWDAMKLHLKLALDNMPSSALDLGAYYLGGQAFFQDLFGPMVIAKAELEIQNLTGPFDININSKESRLLISGLLDQGTLSLKQPIHAQLNLSKNMSKLFLNHLNPLGIEYIESPHPITLHVESAGFSLPLFPYNPKQLQIKFAQVEIGKVHCVSNGNLSLTLSLLKYANASGSLDLWFTPMEFSINSGIVNLTRTDILVANSFQLALWGITNIPEENVDMTLGITAQALRSAFNIGGLPDGYVLRIPVKGRFGDIRIDTKRATSKIAAVLALQQGGALVEQFGGKGGALFGGILKQVQVLPDMDNPAPAPHDPLPWEKSANGPEKNKNPTLKKNKPVKSTDSPLKQLKKILLP